MDLFAVYYIFMYLPSLLLVVLIMDAVYKLPLFMYLPSLFLVVLIMNAVYKLPPREIIQSYFCIAFYCVALYFLGRPSLLGFVLRPMLWYVVAFFQGGDHDV